VRDLFSVEGKTVVVTGGSAGIGRMLVEGFVRAGATVYLSSRKADVCDAVARELSDVGTCRSLPADLATERGCEELATRVGEREQGLDVLVNNAGKIRITPLRDHDDALWDKMMALNVKAAAHLSRFLLPLLTKSAGGDEPARIINIGSVDATRVPPMESYAYTASKAALHHLTRHLAWRLAPDVTVNTIAPGTFRSRMSASYLEGREEEISAGIPLHRIGRPSDAVGSALFLASSAGAYVTGALLPVDGGLSSIPVRDTNEPHDDRKGAT
jgi:NAD(P)-dependent dehydrogenase (short-subunit alcohol dehydrogenase family)